MPITMTEQKKHTLHLPQTDFPMKARLPEKEPVLISFWRKQNIYQKLMDRQKTKKFFSFIDGPPYANGHLHIGHALNKILKDITVKYKNLSGGHCPFIPVWDCHGLPIEATVLKKIRKEKKPEPSLSPKEIRALCRKEALSWVETQKREFQRLGVLADWDNPLLTLHPEYSAGEVQALAKIAKKNLLYRGKKPIHWCSRLRTAIASSEVEYREHKSPSIYVKFPFPAPPPEWKLANKTCSIVIWTTTPWTLPANQAVCLKADFTYAVFKTTGEYLILAQDLKSHFEKNTNLRLTKVLEFKGKSLERKKLKHPFMDKDSLIIMGDHVTKEEGTGCVHTAPGHGVDDFTVGQKYHLPVFTPVDEKGCFTSQAPKEWAGMYVLKANPLIIEKLRQNACLLAEKQITHSYPYNPRSGAPLIFRATDQWFIGLDQQNPAVRKKALSETEHEIQFYPPWGKQRLSAMIKSSPDWCLSRQRHWGVPLPVFYCKECQAPLVSADIMEHTAQQMEETKEGVEYWFSRHPEQLLPPKTACPKCQSQNFKKGEDILDVWFDSGICHHVFAQKYGVKTFPADIYLEGSDQHRGWFQTSLISSVCLNDKTPFKALVTHCFVNDAEGYKMSKSKGNTVNLQKIIEQRGAEIVRLWVCSEDYSQDLQISNEIFERVSETYRRFRNTVRFMLGNLFDFEPEKHLTTFAQMRDTDKWILSRLAELTRQSRLNYDRFLFHKIYQDLNVFFTTDLSSLYLDIIKDRLYTFKKEGKDRRSAQSAIYLLLKNLLSIMSPITSFLSEEAYQSLPGQRAGSVFLEDFPTPPEEWQDPQIKEKFNHFLKIRHTLYPQMERLRREKKIGSSLETKAVLRLPEKAFAQIQHSLDDLREFLIVSQVECTQAEHARTQAEHARAQAERTQAERTPSSPGGAGAQMEVQKADGEKCARCWNYSKQLNPEQICPKCISNLP